MPILEANLIKQCLVASWKDEALFPQALSQAVRRHFPTHQSSFPAGSANVFYKGLDSKQFKVCGPHDLWHSYDSALSLSMKAVLENM